jgi:hypothetical protein
VNWDYRRRMFWRGASLFSGVCAFGFTVTGFGSGTPALIALAVCFTILTLSFGRRARP